MEALSDVIELFQIDEILRGEDIEGLLDLGAPRDEYSSEAKAIFSALVRLKDGDVTESILCDLIAQIWIRSFGAFDEGELEKRSVAFHRVAQQLLSHLGR